MRMCEVFKKRLLLVSVCILAGSCLVGQSAEAKEKWVKSKTGLSSLIQLGKDRAAMEKEYSSETKSYDALKKAVDRGDLKEGMAAKDVRRKFGEPVVEFSDKKTDTAKWVYKPGTENFLDGADKIYLIFDANNSLVEWKSVKKKEKPEEEKE